MTEQILSEQALAIPLKRAAARLGVSYYTLFRGVHAGRVRATRIGSRLLVPVSECERILRDGLELPPRGRPRKAPTPMPVDATGAGAADGAGEETAVE